MSTAIVIGYKGINSTGLIRSLGMGGFDVVFASSYSKIESRYTTAYLKLPVEEDERARILYEYLRTLPEKAAIFTGDDASNAFLDRYYDLFSPYCFCPHAKNRLKEISDKAEMARIALSVRLNVPENYLVDLSTNCNCMLPYPVIIKPFAGYAGSKSDIRICYDDEAFKNSIVYLKENAYQKVMIQRFLDSTNQQDICLMGYSLENGIVKIPCAIRKLRSYPSKRGSLSFGHVENNLISQDTIRKLEMFVRKIGYVGIFDIDIILSDNEPYFIEINYRNGQNGYVSTAAGYNIPANWFRGMQGMAVDEVEPLDELFYMDEHCDYKHIREGNISLRQWLSEKRKVSVFAMYCKGDQRPFFRQYIRFPESWKRKLLKLLHIG